MTPHAIAMLKTCWKQSLTMGVMLILSGFTEPTAYGQPDPKTEIMPLPEEILRIRDPFKRPSLKFSEEVAKTPLQNYAISSMKMIGILTGPLRMRAMIKTPDGKTHFVAENMPIGDRNGVIRKITEDRIYVRERIGNILGQVENVDTELPLLEETRRSSDDDKPDSTKMGIPPNPANPGVPPGSS